mgnify:CR=1 FL=1
MSGSAIMADHPPAVELSLNESTAVTSASATIETTTLLAAVPSSSSPTSAAVAATASAPEASRAVSHDHAHFTIKHSGRVF